MCRASGLPVPPSPSEFCDSRNPSLISLYFCHVFRFVSASFLSLSGEKLTNWGKVGEQLGLQPFHTRSEDQKRVPALL